MPDQRRYVYWDADCWLSYLNAVPERLPILDSLLADSSSDSGAVRIVTSAISQVEVAFGAAEQAGQALDPSVEQRIDSLWADRSAVLLIEYHEAIGVEARQLIRLSVGRGWSLKPMDAIHLATARWFRVSEFHTYETRLRRYGDDLGFPIVQPYTQTPQLL